MARELHSSYTHAVRHSRYSHLEYKDDTVSSRSYYNARTEMDSTVTSVVTQTGTHTSQTETVLTTYSDVDNRHTSVTGRFLVTGRDTSSLKSNIFGPNVYLGWTETGHSSREGSTQYGGGGTDIGTVKQTSVGRTGYYSATKSSSSGQSTTIHDDSSTTATASASNTTQTTRTRSESIKDTTISIGMNLTGTHTYDPFRTVNSTSSTTVSTTTTAHTSSTTKSSWTWVKGSYVEETATDTNNWSNTTSITDQTLSYESSTLSQLATSYDIYNLSKHTVYLSSDERLWSVTAPPASDYTASAFWSDLFSSHAGSSFTYEDRVPTITRSIPYTQVTETYASQTFSRVEQTGESSSDTGSVTYTNRSTYRNGALWRQIYAGSTSTMMPRQTSTFNKSPTLPTVFSRTGTGTNTNGITYVNLVTHVLSFDTNNNYVTTIASTSTYGVSEEVTQTYYAWHGSRTSSSYVYEKVKVTLTELIESRVIDGTVTNRLGYRSVTNEAISVIGKSSSYVTWDEDSVAFSKILTYSFYSERNTSASGSTTFAANPAFLISSSSSSTGSSDTITTWTIATHDVTEYNIIDPAILQTYYSGNNNYVTMMTPESPHAVAGFGNKENIHGTNMYAYIDVASAGDTFTSYQEIKSHHLSYKSYDLHGMVVMTDSCNSGAMNYWGSYQWSVPANTTNFSNASTLLATHSSTTSTNVGTGTTSTATYKYATYTLSCVHPVTGDFFNQVSINAGSHVNNGHVTNLIAYSFGYHSPLTAARSLYLPVGKYSMTTHNNVTGATVSGSYLHTATSGHLITLNSDQALYIELERIITYQTANGGGINWTVRSV